MRLNIIFQEASLPFNKTGFDKEENVLLFVKQLNPKL